MTQNFRTDLYEILTLMKGNEPFAFMRFADGEIGVMQGRQVDGSDKWKSPNRVTKLGVDLLTAVSRINSNVYYGISCQCCDQQGKEYLLSLIRNPVGNITFSNIFVNGNYGLFLEQLANINKPVYVIANHTATFANFPLPILGFVPVPDDCVNYWEESSIEIKQALAEAFQEVTDQLFLIAAGPMSEAIIDFLWTVNPTNQYVDVGSSIAEYVHGRPIRDFAYAGSPYHNKYCIF